MRCKIKKYIELSELRERAELNFCRLNEEYYRIDSVLDGDEAGWPGDKEGRALLAFASHYAISGRKIPCMEQLIDRIPEATGGSCFFGEPTGEIPFEQQLSGHSWYLRGLCEYYELLGDGRALDYLNKTFEALYLPLLGRIDSYPVEREQSSEGGVSGHTEEAYRGWLLSSDVGCAFMSIDGLSHYYAVTENEAARRLVDEMIAKFDSIDKYALGAQTHCTLTAARGMLRMYGKTGERDYFEKAEKIFRLYVEKGMTYTYQNFNWFGREDSWTEPCAIVDSLMLAVSLYKLTGDDEYRSLAARIYFNGLATAQRPNGGAGTDTTVFADNALLSVDMYEAYFCCTMRLAEGLRFLFENRESLWAETSGSVTKDEKGRYLDGDILYCEIPLEAEPLAEGGVTVDGRRLFPIVKLYRLADEADCRSVAQKIVFKQS